MSPAMCSHIEKLLSRDEKRGEAPRRCRHVNFQSACIWSVFLLSRVTLLLQLLNGILEREN